MASEPLSIYLNSLKEPVKFLPPTSACWRGYYGNWEIIGDKLHLIGLQAYLDGYVIAGVEYLFPEKSKVFAYWFTGTVRLQVGELLHYEHAGYFSVYEKDIFLGFENGRLVDTNERINEVPTEDISSIMYEVSPNNKGAWIKEREKLLMNFLRVRK
ncbi:MAG: hypothetical protein IPP86_17950 [Bacteroidetes bacterium]|nr:hypothetical protein [Bacteroidota bacterium]